MAQVSLKSVNLPNGETLGYREREGGDKLLVLVHGNMNSSKHWDLVLENLDASFKVYAIDLRGFGISTYNQRIVDLGDLTSDLKLFVDALGLKGFSLAGWSTGGGVIMQFAADYPEYVQKLILVDSMSTRGYPFYETDENWMPNLNNRIRTQEQMDLDFRTRTVFGGQNNRDRNLMRFMFDATVYVNKKPSAELYEEYIDDILTQRNLPEIYHGLNVFNISNVDGEVAQGSGAIDRIVAPTLVLWGELDIVCPRNMTDEIMEDFGDRATLVVLPNCGHSPLVDDIDRICSEMAKFLNS
jgi:pimeloyl-ACP methyl ester carboxylesterase